MFSSRFVRFSEKSVTHTDQAARTCNNTNVSEVVPKEGKVKSYNVDYLRN